MALETVVFVRCDLCDARWESPPGYKPVPLVWDGSPVLETDLCTKCRTPIDTALLPVLEVARAVTPVKRSHTRKPGVKGTFVCSCGRDFNRRMGITRHLNGSLGAGHHIVQTPTEGEA